jgi:hypothetical protein
MQKLKISSNRRFPVYEDGSPFYWFGDTAWELPLIDEGPAKPNEEYFQHIDWIIQKAESMGLWFGILPTWGDKVGHTHGAGPPHLHPRMPGSAATF